MAKKIDQDPGAWVGKDQVKASTFKAAATAPNRANAISMLRP